MISRHCGANLKEPVSYTCQWRQRESTVQRPRRRSHRPIPFSSALAFKAKVEKGASHFRLKLWLLVSPLSFNETLWDNNTRLYSFNKHLLKSHYMCFNNIIPGTSGRKTWLQKDHLYKIRCQFADGNMGVWRLQRRLSCKKTGSFCRGPGLACQHPHGGLTICNSSSRGSSAISRPSWALSTLTQIHTQAKLQMYIKQK